MFWYYFFPPLIELAAALLVYGGFLCPYCRRHPDAWAVKIFAPTILFLIYLIGAANFLIRDNHFAAWALWTSGLCVALILIWALGTGIYLTSKILSNIIKHFSSPRFNARWARFKDGKGFKKFKMAYFIFFALVYPLLGLWGGGQPPRAVYLSLNLSRAPSNAFPTTPHDFKVVFLSDLHLGTWQGNRAYLANVVELVNQQHPDLVLIGGDLVDHDQASFVPLLQPLQDLNAPWGVYFALGNHEGLSPTPHLLQELEILGVHPLVNQSVVIGGRFNVAGVGDIDCGHWGERYLPQRPSDIDGSLPTILLAHRPNLMRDENLAAVDLALMGHTHGGQIEPFSILPRLTNLYFKGLYRRPREKKDVFGKLNTAPAMTTPLPAYYHADRNTAFYYVSQGTGTSGPPMRFMTFSEITVLYLHF